MNTEKTGLFIAELRKSKNITQSQLAEMLHVSDKAVSRWETGRGFPDINNLENLSDCLEVSVAELLKGERAAEAVSREELENITEEGISLTKAFMNRKRYLNILTGFILGLIIISASVVHLNSPVYIKDPDSALKIEELTGGRVVALLNENASGYEIERVRDEESGGPLTFIGCYQTRLSQITGKKSDTIVNIGEKGEVGKVYYYPSDGADELIYDASGTSADENGGVMTLPRLLYNFWLMVGIALTAIGFIAYALCRKKHYGEKILKTVLLPAAFTVSIPVCLAGHFDEIYNAAYYFSGIVLLTAAIYALFRLILIRGISKRGA